MSPEYTLELFLYCATLGINGMMFGVVCEAIDKKGEIILEKIIQGIKND